MATTPLFIKKTKHINGISLFNEIMEEVEEIIMSFSIDWNSEYPRDVVLEMIDEHLYAFQEAGKIEQWDVICDRRNNSDKSIVQLDIMFKQRNCLNTTTVYYTINYRK